MTPSPSEHTILINNIIAMLSPNNPWPSPLSNMGYRLLSVEEKFNVGTQGNNSCNPDVISVESKKNIAMLFECKGGKTVDENQLRNYLSVTSSDLVHLVTVDDYKKTTVHFVYASCNYSELIKSMKITLKKIKKIDDTGEAPADIDIIELTNRIIKVYSTHDNQWSSDLISGIQISEGTFPMYYYPFSDDDDGEYVLGEVLRSIIHLIAKKPPINPDEIVLTTDEVVLDIFGAHPYISSHQKRRLARLVDVCFLKLTKEKSLKGKVFRIGIRGRPLSMKKTKEIRDDLIKIGKEIQEGLTQAPLEDFF